MADDDSLIASTAEALLRERRRRWGSVHQGDCITDARAVIAAVRDQIAAEALREAALAIDSGDADHEELRQGGIDGIWPRGWSKASVIAARHVGSVWADWLRARADRLDPKESDHG